MKIHTRKLPSEEVLKLPRLQHKKPLKPSRFLATVVRIACAPTLWSTQFSYTTERMELVKAMALPRMRRVFISSPQ